jgi:hypothetical protein
MTVHAIFRWRYPDAGMTEAFDLVSLAYARWKRSVDLLVREVVRRRRTRAERRRARPRGPARAQPAADRAQGALEYGRLARTQSGRFAAQRGEREILRQPLPRDNRFSFSGAAKARRPQPRIERRVRAAARDPSEVRVPD